MTNLRLSQWALFDTSVLVPALVDQLSTHERCFLTFRDYAGSDFRGYCSTRGLAECYSVLTATAPPATNQSG